MNEKGVISRRVNQQAWARLITMDGTQMWQGGLDRRMTRHISERLYGRIEEAVADPVMIVIEDVFRIWMPAELKNHYG